MRKVTFSLSPTGVNGMMWRLRSCLIAIALMLSAGQVLAQSYKITQLPDAVPIANSSTAMGINDVGQVVGQSGGHLQPWLWTIKNGVVASSSAISAASGEASAINHNGLIAGSLLDANDLPHATVWIVSGGSYSAIDLGAPSGYQYSLANGINDLGVVAGYFMDANSISHATAWKIVNGSYSAIELGVPAGYAGSWANSINGAGLIAGYVSDANNVEHAAVWSPSGAAYVLTILPELSGSTGSMAVSINDAGEVVGNSGPTISALWSPVNGAYTVSALSNVSGEYDSLAYAINNAGMIAGISVDSAGGHIALWTLASGTYSATNVAAISSSVNASVSFYQAFAMNAGGQVVGYNVINAGVSHAFLWTPVSGGYIAVDLGAPGVEMVNSSGSAVNAAGQVVGYSDNQPALWSLTNGAYFPDLIPEVNSAGFGAGGGVGIGSSSSAINNAGQVALDWGYVTSACGPEGCMTSTIAALWDGVSDPAVQLIQTNLTNDSYGEANAINDKGQIVGQTASGGTLWNPEGGSYLPVSLTLPPGYTVNDATAINNAGQIVGYSASPTEPNHATLWNFVGNTYAAVDLGTLPGYQSSMAYAINGSAQVVGYSEGASQMSGGYVRTATLWSLLNGTYVASALHPLPGYLSSQASAINDAGQVVGFSTNCIDCYIWGTDYENARATLWTGSQIIDLNSELGAANDGLVVLTTASAINNNGLIVANGTDEFRDILAFVLAPAPVTVTLLLNPDSVSTTTASVLAWSTTGSPDSCVAAGAWTGSRDPTGGTIKVGPYSATGYERFTLLCTNSVTGQSGMASATLTVTGTGGGGGALEFESVVFLAGVATWRRLRTRNWNARASRLLTHA